MAGLVLTPAQVATVLDASGLAAGVGSPLHGIPAAEPLPIGHPERQQLVARSALLTAGGGQRPNAALVSAMRACADPDEVLWFGTAARDASVTVCRRGRLLVECSQQADGRVRVVFPLDRAQVILLATAALSGDRSEPTPSGFALRVPLADAFLLRVIADLAAQRSSDGGPTRADVVAAIGGGLRDERQFVAASGFGDRADLRRFVDDPRRFDDAVARLAAAGHLVAGEFRLSPATASILDTAPVATLGLGRRIVARGPDGERRLAERRLRVERRGERLVSMRVVSVDGDPHLEMVERTRAEIRSLVGVFLLGEAWDRVAAAPPPPPP